MAAQPSKNSPGQWPRVSGATIRAIHLSIVPNAFVIAVETAVGGKNDYNDLVLLIKNVKGLP